MKCFESLVAFGVLLLCLVYRNWDCKSNSYVLGQWIQPSWTLEWSGELLKTLKAHGINISGGVNQALVVFKSSLRVQCAARLGTTAPAPKCCWCWVFLTPTAVTWPFCFSQAKGSVRVVGSWLEHQPQHSAWPLEGTRVTFECMHSGTEVVSKHTGYASGQ